MSVTNGTNVTLPPCSQPTRHSLLLSCRALPAGRGVSEVVMLVDAFKHYSKYASQALKVAMPKGGKGGMMRADNARNMQQVR